MQRPRSLMLIALLAGFSLVAAACGDDDDDAAPATTAAAAETTAAPETTEAMTENTGAAGDIVDVAAGAGDFTTLVAAVQAAGLEETLRGDGPYTVFAPTDDAFAALPEGLVDALLADTDALTQVLTYHVVPDEVPAADVVGLDSATTVNGADVPIAVDGETVMVGEATVVTTDVPASNGVIHVIDAVLVPPGIDVDALLTP